MAERFLKGTTPNPLFSDNLIKLLPKSDIHCHLDGSMRLKTLIELSQEQGLELPSYDEEELRAILFPPTYKDLVEYLKGFSYLTAVLRDAKALERVSFEVAEDCYCEGVRYVELRFAPHLHAIPEKLSVEEIILSVNRGLERAAKIYNNIDEDVKSGLAPEYKYGIIVCGMRYFNEHFSPYYSQLIEMFKHEDKKTLYGLATKQLVKEAVFIRDTMGIPIVALDIAGPENHYPAADHAEAFKFAHENFMNKTIHAGEAYGPESIYQALTCCYAERIGHGLHMFDEIFHPHTSVKDKKKYIDGIVRSVANKRTCIEVCLTSNFQTDPAICEDPTKHPLAEFLKEKLSVCLNTDNRLVSNTNMCQEVRLAVDIFRLTREELWDIIHNGFKRSFMTGSYADKREYLQKIKDYYNHITRICDDEENGGGAAKRTKVGGAIA